MSVFQGGVGVREVMDGGGVVIKSRSNGLYEATHVGHGFYCVLYKAFYRKFSHRKYK